MRTSWGGGKASANECEQEAARIPPRSRCSLRPHDAELDGNVTRVGAAELFGRRLGNVHQKRLLQRPSVDDADEDGAPGGATGEQDDRAVRERRMAADEGAGIVRRAAGGEPPFERRRVGG